MTKRSGPQRVATDARADLGSYPLHSMVVPKSEEDSDGRGSGFRVPVAQPHRPPEPRVELFCPFPSGLNSHAETVQRESVDWAVRSGLVPEAQMHVSRAPEIGWLNALVFHSAPLEVLRLAADWTTLFCALDDSVELFRRGPVELSAFLARALATLRGQAERASSPIEIAFADLRRRMLGLAGPRWTGAVQPACRGDLWRIPLGGNQSLEMLSPTLRRLSGDASGDGWPPSAVLAGGVGPRDRTVQ